MAPKLTTFETPFETYTVAKTIGEGGAGRVYEVTNSSGDVFALKCLAAERITKERLKRFKNEVEFCQRCDHPNIVRVLDMGTTLLGGNKCPFYVMKRYTGTLRTHIGRLEPSEAIRAFSQMLDGVEAAHLLGVWHRDLKPENVLWNEAERALVVADFGIAHFEEEEIYTAVETKVAARMANFQYSAPEQRARGLPIDSKVDIFSLGLILNEMFTSEVAQGSGHKRIADLHPTYAYLDAVVDSMIQQNPQKRPASIEAIKKELISQKNAFVAFQQLDEAKRRVVPTSAEPEFDPIAFINVDYEQETLKLKLSRKAPIQWAAEFHQLRGGHESYVGYGPEAFQIVGDTVSIRTRDDSKFIQELVNFAKQYLASANRGYLQFLRDCKVKEERDQRAALEKLVAEKELRNNILANVKL